MTQGEVPAREGLASAGGADQGVPKLDSRHDYMTHKMNHYLTQNPLIAPFLPRGAQGEAGSDRAGSLWGESKSIIFDASESDLRPGVHRQQALPQGVAVSHVAASRRARGT